MRFASLLLALSAVLVLDRTARADEPFPSDRGTFEIHVRGRTVGREIMTLQDDGDSLAITSSSIQLLGAEGADSLIKKAGIGVDSYDLNLRSYDSSQRFRGHVVTRGLSLHDTLFTSYRDLDGRGSGDTFARPPGHLFVVDPGVFASFDLVCRMLRGRSFERRSVNLIVLGGETDTVVAAPLVDHGTEAFHWGSRTMTARRFTLGDEPGPYQIWMASDGRMLRLEHVPSGLRVDRVAAKVPPRKTPQPH